MTRVRKARLAASILLAASGPLHAQEAMLKHDPFSRPAAAKTQRAPSADDKAGTAPARDEQWNPELRAVMLAGRASMANVDGAVVRIGEEVNGYRLVELRDGEAVFTKDGERVTVSMRRPDVAQLAGEKR